MALVESKMSSFAKLVMLFVCGALLINMGRAGSHGPHAENERPLLLPPRSLSSFTLGYGAIVADSLWIRVIQDFDYCENRPLGVYDPSKFKCSNGWVYNMLDSITELDPLFVPPYLSGATMLSIVVNDQIGATKIFDNATKRFPKHWQIQYYGAYQALYEENDLAKASARLEAAAENGSPGWVYSLAARLQQKLGKLEMARSIITDALENNPNGSTAPLFKKRLDEIDAEIAKQQAAEQGIPDKSKH